MGRLSTYRTRLRRDDNRINWRRRPSEIRGYNRALYVNTEAGDYIRVDYNLKDKRVRLYIEDVEEGGNPYYAVITDGRVTAERNVTTGRSYNLSEKFRKRAAIFSQIPNTEIINIINKNYGIGERETEERERRIQRQQELEETRRRYFRENPYVEFGGGITEGEIEKQVRLIDLFDVAVGIVLCFGAYYYWHSFISVGIVSAFFGVLLAVLDIFFRVREPFLMKNVTFVLAGLTAYIYGYYFF